MSNNYETNLVNLIRNCKYGSSIINSDKLKMSNISLIPNLDPNSDDACIDLEMEYNLKKKNQHGTSYKYTTYPNTSTTNYEYFNNLTNYNVFIKIIFIIIIIYVIHLTFLT